MRIIITCLIALVLGCVAVVSAQRSNEREARQVLQHFKEDVLTFRDEVERAYSRRCETATLHGCSRASLSSCSSSFSNGQCTTEEELSIPACDEGAYCSSLWDAQSSAVSLPSFLDQDPEVIETICYSLLAEPFMVESFERDTEWHARYGSYPSWRYFGAHDGIFRKIPAHHQEVCGEYDPRKRPWYVAASSGPKDVILVIDVSGSMGNHGRLSLAKEAATTVIETLTVADRFAIIPFSHEARFIGGPSETLLRATKDNKDRLVSEIENLYAEGSTNFGDGLFRAFSALENTIQQEVTSGCNAAILFLTDGESTSGMVDDEVIHMVKKYRSRLENNHGKKTTVFAYSLGAQADHATTKAIACNTGGLWTSIDDGGDLLSAMSGYYKLFSIGLGDDSNMDFVSVVEPYEDFTSGKHMTTFSGWSPVYDRSVTPHLFLGVVGVDQPMDALERILGEDASSSAMLKRFISLSTAMCPNINLVECYLEQLRLIGGGEDAMCGTCPDNLSVTSIIPEECPFVSDLPNDIWANTDLEGMDFEEKSCCAQDPGNGQESCSAWSPGEDFSAGGLGPIGFAIIAGLSVLVGCCCCFFFVVKKAVVSASLATNKKGNVWSGPGSSQSPVAQVLSSPPASSATYATAAAPLQIVNPVPSHGVATVVQPHVPAPAHMGVTILHPSAPPQPAMNPVFRR
ncbi:hypothetical protein THAOC_01427 [Thalassiosira oceanica]|uniref:VWFA domain-containing protein n=1 Tax=Thalassiosira oceanica TaxID=159749 RepID=K0TQX2_THAOC|nr:hypothetical protein THAOC_01427 [Thalassiosira oceanica]|eukprot:EJK76792.1 hypothetical protein THAOC_01427 [Thalassiosira oceanica]